MQLVLQCDLPAASLIKENIEGGTKKTTKTLFLTKKIWVVSMFWAVWQSSSLHLHRQRGWSALVSHHLLWAATGRNVPHLHHFVTSPLSSLCPRQTQPVQHRNLSPHTLLRPSVPLCRLFHFINSRVTFIVVSAK